jgi:hypothetical protein
VGKYEISTGQYEEVAIDVVEDAVAHGSDNVSFLTGTHPLGV